MKTKSIFILSKKFIFSKYCIKNHNIIFLYNILIIVQLVFDPFLTTLEKLGVFGISLLPIIFFITGMFDYHYRYSTYKIKKMLRFSLILFIIFDLFVIFISYSSIYMRMGFHVSVILLSITYLEYKYRLEIEKIIDNEK